MFGLFKKRPQKFEINYETSSKIASAIEGFLLVLDSDRPNEDIKKYSFIVSKSHMLSVQHNDTLTNGENDALIIVPFKELSSVDDLSRIVISTFKPGPFVSPFLNEITTEVCDYISSKNPD